MHPRRRRSCWLTAVALLPVYQGVEGAEFSRYLTVTSDYVFRGVTYSSGDAAAQLGIDAAFENGFYSGLWASTVDIGVEPYAHRDLEVDYYLGYRQDLSREWSVDAHVAAFTFPGSSGSIDYDYEEYALSVNYGDRAWLEYAFSPDLSHSGQHAHNLSVYTEWPLGKNLVGGGAGYAVVADLAGDNYAYWQLGVTRAFDRLAFDLRYHDTSRWVHYLSSEDRTGPRIALSLRLAF